jgi:diguanylate cyclase (GGDEF)-like protein
MQRGHGLYCELEHLRETSLLEVRHDPVTGIFNRDTMLTLLFRETDRVQRLRGALSTVMLELDDFARLRSDLGTHTADCLLHEVAIRLGRMLRSYDLLGRGGPESFLMALPGCSTINAMMLAERMRIEVFGEPFLITPNEGTETQIQLTTCAAVASSRGRSPIIVLRETEHTLAQAKLSGPNTLRCASESPLSAEITGPHLFPQAEMAVW